MKITGVPLWLKNLMLIEPTTGFKSFHCYLTKKPVTHTVTVYNRHDRISSKRLTYFFVFWTSLMSKNSFDIFPQARTLKILFKTKFTALLMIVTYDVNKKDHNVYFISNLIKGCKNIYVARFIGWILIYRIIFTLFLVDFCRFCYFLE